MAVTTSAQHWSSLRWFDWVGVVGTFLTLVGLVLTWNQARKAASAARAAEQAVTHTEEEIRAKQLLVLIPQLRWIVRELDWAIDGNDTFYAQRQLEAWRAQTSNIHGILSVSKAKNRQILQRLTESIGLVETAQEALADASISVGTGCAKARTAMARTCDQLDMWAGRQSTQVIRSGGNAP